MEVETAPASSVAGQVVRAVVAERDQLDTRLGEIGLQRRAPVLVLVGGAGGMDAGAIAELEHLFRQAIAPLASALGAYVVDGGTDTGVMGLMGRARAAIGAEFPLIGVLPADALDASSTTGHRARIEPHHSHVVLVPEASWQAAGPWISWVAEALSGGLPSVTLLINGGDISWDDALRSVRDRRPVIAVAGSGRAADALAAALDGEAWDPRAHEVLASGLVEAVSVADGPAILGRRLGSYLTATPEAAVPEQPAPQEHDALEGKDLKELIEDLELSDLQKHALRSRWLGQTLWMSRKAAQAQKRYYALRLIVIIGSIALPMLMAVAGNDDGGRTLATITSSIVAISAAIEEFFHYGERWQHYRRTAERLKLEGWRFFQRTGPYRRFASHSLAYREFAGVVERLIEDDVDVYISEIANDRRRDGSQLAKPARSVSSS